jgi:hypothetical protein
MIAAPDSKVDETILKGVRAIAAHLQVDERRVEYLRYSKGLPTFNRGRAVCAHASELDEWKQKENALQALVDWASGEKGGA